VSETRRREKTSVRKLDIRKRKGKKSLIATFKIIIKILTMMKLEKIRKKALNLTFNRLIKNEIFCRHTFVCAVM
jgi:hypothetical protein